MTKKNKLENMQIINRIKLKQYQKFKTNICLAAKNFSTMITSLHEWVTEERQTGIMKGKQKKLEQ